MFCHPIRSVQLPQHWSSDKCWYRWSSENRKDRLLKATPNRPQYLQGGVHLAVLYKVRNYFHTAKWPSHETDHSSSHMSNTEAKNEWIYNFIPPYAFKGWRLIKHKGNSIFHSRNIFYVIFRVIVSVIVEITGLRGGPGSSVSIATIGWTIRDRIPVGTTFSARLDWHWGPPSLL